MISSTAQTARFAEALAAAVNLHKAGRIAEALAQYETLAREQPKEPQLLYLLGTAYVQLGRGREAVAPLERSLALRADFGPAVEALASALTQAGKPAEALPYFRRAAVAAPHAPDAADRLASAYMMCGQFAEAESVVRATLARHPKHAPAYTGLGMILGIGERYAEAEQVLVAAVGHAPQSADAWRWLGVARHKLGRIAEAVPAYTQALALKPANALIAAHLGEALVDLNRLEEAEPVLRGALAQTPDDPGLLTALGRIHELRGELDQAIAVQSRIIALNPSFEAAYLNRGSARRFAGDYDGALADYDAALALKPTMAQAVANRALTLLIMGRLAEAWPLYRARIKALGGAPDLSGDRPWDGTPLAGKRALIWGEYGLGDEIMFASLLPELTRDAARSTLVCAPRLATLFQRSFPNLDVAPLGADVAGDFDARLPLIDAAALLRPRLADFPAHEGYVKADPARTARLRERYQAGTGNLLVGVSWRSASGATGRFKSAGLEQWCEILGVPGITFVSLQYGDAAGDIARAGANIVVDPAIDSSGDLDPFAAQVAAMDLVISVSNTTVHMAGALAKPVWVLTPTGPGAHWYWFRERADSPWYPSAKLFRQSTPGSWAEPLAAVAAALRNVPRP
ncbi:MAG: tetratricopeptide repeat protein [Rhodospirillaceae bacterium]|nr:tetratricopeptide repeat protein [Rhodospirillaceae bacterium]